MDNIRERRKHEARKMPQNAAESPPSATCFVGPFVSELAQHEIISIKNIIPDYGKGQGDKKMHEEEFHATPGFRNGSKD